MLRQLLTSLVVVAMLGGGIARGQYDEDVALVTLSEVGKVPHGLSDADYRRKLRELCVFLEKRDSRAILSGMHILSQRDPRAFEGLDVPFTALLERYQTYSSERDLCRVCEWLVDMPAISTTSLATMKKVMNDESRLFAPPIAAVIVLKAEPDSAATIQWLERRLSDENSKQRMLTARAVGHLESRAKRFAPQLHKLLDDPAVDVRVAASISLFHIEGSSPAIVRALRESLQGQDTVMTYEPYGMSEWVLGHQFRAVTLLGLIGLPASEAVDDILPFLDDKDDSMMRLRSVVALERIGVKSPKVLQKLRERTKDENVSVAAAAEQALTKLTNPTP